MSVEFNRDTGKIENFHKNNEGYLEIGVVTGLPGVILNYSDRKETISLDALKSAETLKTLVGKPLTINHPNVAINATNRRKYEVGVFLQNTRLNADGVPIADAIVTDADTISKIEKGEISHVSMGYFADKQINQDGVYVQLNRNYNHGALLDVNNVPRAGAESKLYLQKDSLLLEEFNLDSSGGGEKTEKDTKDKKKETIKNNAELADLTEENQEKSQSSSGTLTSKDNSNKRPAVTETPPESKTVNKDSQSMQLDAKEIANRVELISEWKSVLDEEGVSINYNADTATIKKQILGCYYPKEVLNQINQDSINGFWLGFVSEHYSKRESERQKGRQNKDSKEKFNYDAESLRQEYVKLIC